MYESTTAVSTRRSRPDPAGSLGSTPAEREFFVRGRLAPPDFGTPAPLPCHDCGVRTPRADLLFSEHGRVCLECHGEHEVARVDLSPWRDAAPILAMIAGLVTVAVILPQVARIVLSLGPTGAIAWVVMNVLPASFGVFLVIAALRLLRDAWTNPLDEEVPFVEGLLRTGAAGLAVVASVVGTVAFPILALWPFLL